MLAIPLALIGVFWGHFLLGYSLSMPSIMGFVSLAGIVVNDSILLVQYIRRHIDLGDDVYEAVVSASRERFRAVMLTSLTTAAGLLPILLETSLQAQVVKPLVISIVFGIFASTLLVLLVIPCAYAIMADFGRIHRHESPGSAIAHPDTPGPGPSSGVGLAHDHRSHGTDVFEQGLRTALLDPMRQGLGIDEDRHSVFMTHPIYLPAERRELNVVRTGLAAHLPPASKDDFSRRRVSGLRSRPHPSIAQDIGFVARNGGRQS